MSEQMEALAATLGITTAELKDKLDLLLLRFPEAAKAGPYILGALEALAPMADPVTLAAQLQDVFVEVTGEDPGFSTSAGFGS